jgi:hypothetical protein
LFSAILAGAAINASATVVTWDFTGTEVATGVPTGNITTGPGGTDPSYTFVSDGIGLTTRAFRLRDGASGFDWSHVSRNANNGLAVSRQNSAIGENGTIDNLGTATDLLVFDFGTAVFDSWTIDFTVNSANDNASIWAGNGLASLDDLIGLDFAALVSTAGFDLIDGDLNVALNDPYSFAGSYRYFVVSAQFNQDNDNFRIGSISANLVSAPAPGTGALGPGPGAGAGGRDRLDQIAAQTVPWRQIFLASGAVLHAPYAKVRRLFRCLPTRQRER